MASLPALIALVIMAVAIPIAGTLVRQKQDNRNLAATNPPAPPSCDIKAKCLPPGGRVAIPKSYYGDCAPGHIYEGCRAEKLCRQLNDRCEYVGDRVACLDTKETDCNGTQPTPTQGPTCTATCADSCSSDIGCRGKILDTACGYDKTGKVKHMCRICTQVCVTPTMGRPTGTVTPSVKPTMTPTLTPTTSPSPTPTITSCKPVTFSAVPTAVCDSGNGAGSATWKWATVASASMYQIDIYKADGTLLIDNDWLLSSEFGCKTGICSYGATLPMGTYYAMISTQSYKMCSPSTWTKSDNVTVNPCAPPVCDKKLDIGLVFDRSATMTDPEVDGRQKLAWAKDAAGVFLQSLKNTGTKTVSVSISSFGAQGNDNTGSLKPWADWNSTLNIALTNIGTDANYLLVKNALAGVNYKQWGTCIECGIRIENGQLTNTTNRRVEILLSDGMANHNWDGSTSNSEAKAIAAANAGRTNGIEFRVIGYGKRGMADPEIDETTLLAIAGSAANYQYKPNATDWSNAFITILNDLCK